MAETNRPEWAPDDAGDEFASRLSKGSGEDARPSKPRIKREELDAQYYVDGTLAGDRAALARAVTLIESSAPAHFDKAQEVLQKLLPESGGSVRIAVTGSPGSGKSSFIETLGLKLCRAGRKVAALAIDPSSPRSKGSILGDKTRMEELARHENAFIRPSPSGGVLGGVARKTRESIIACEAAGYEVVFIETVGAGQSEIAVRSMSDYFALLLLPGGGDELQGIKKGAVEIADALIVNKADGNAMARAKATQAAYKDAVSYIVPATDGWETKVFAASAITGLGIDEIWRDIETFAEITKSSGLFYERRREQALEWMRNSLEDELKRRFYRAQGMAQRIDEMENAVLNETITPTMAVKKLLDTFFQSK